MVGVVEFRNIRNETGDGKNSTLFQCSIGNWRIGGQKMAYEIEEIQVKPADFLLSVRAF